MFHYDQREDVRPSYPHFTGGWSGSGTTRGWVVVRESEVPGVNALCGGQPGSPATPPPFGDRGAEDQDADERCGQARETHLKKGKLLSAIESVGDFQLIGVGGFV